MQPSSSESGDDLIDAEKISQTVQFGKTGFKLMIDEVSALCASVYVKLGRALGTVCEGPQ